jgi:hypothetical protein
VLGIIMLYNALLVRSSINDHQLDLADLHSSVFC